MTIKKPPLWATALTILGVLILCALGTWQLQRLEWKRGLIAEIEAQYTQEATQNPLSINSKNITRGYVSGHFQNNKSFKIGPRTNDGAPGYHLITPLKIVSSNQHVLINRGWIPFNDDQAYEAPSGIVNVQGLLRIPDKNNPFTPENETAKNIWYHIDFSAVATAHDLENLWPMVLYAENSEKKNAASQYPIAITEKPELPNDHMQYAFFWFAMAGTLMVIYVLRFVRNTD